MTPQEVQQYLGSFINHEIHLDQIRSSSFKLERVQQLLKNLGDPHKDLKVIHVAGSKGKGSICALTASILQSAGYKVGLYTSPHINNYRERIRVLNPSRSNLKQTPGVDLCSMSSPRRRGSRAIDLDSRLRGNDKVGCGNDKCGSPDIFPDCIKEDELSAELEEIKPAIETMRSQKEWGILSFFEVTTVLALYYFNKQKADLVVLETGLGGRLDATNAVDSIIAVIAPISLEHTNILGTTITQIAKEKAGIIKDRRQKVVIAAQDDEAKSVLENRCREFGIDPLRVEDHVKSNKGTQDGKYQIFDLTTPRAAYKQLALPLLGKHQRDNAAASICAVECLQDLINRGQTPSRGLSPARGLSPKRIREGIKNVFWPGRFEIIKEEPVVVLDGAHNAASVRVLCGTMKEVFQQKKIILVLGISNDKDKAAMCEEFRKMTENIIFVKADHPRASDFPGAVNVKTGLDLAYSKVDREDIILVTGSIFVVSEARNYLLLKVQECIR